MLGGTVRRILVALACAAAFASSATAAPRQPTVSLSPLESGVLADVNAIRAQHHLVPLRLSVQLSDAARQHTQEMGADGYFAHNSVDGSAFWKRVQRFYASARFGYWSVGENLLWSSPDVSPESALNMWMGSPEHRANLLSPRWREIGVAAVHVTAAPGIFKGLDVTIVTTDFGVRH
jgi:uncharacterized protein YkwD